MNNIFYVAVSLVVFTISSMNINASPLKAEGYAGNEYIFQSTWSWDPNQAGAGLVTNKKFEGDWDIAFRAIGMDLVDITQHINAPEIHNDDAVESSWFRYKNVMGGTDNPILTVIAHDDHYDEFKLSVDDTEILFFGRHVGGSEPNAQTAEYCSSATSSECAIRELGVYVVPLPASAWLFFTGLLCLIGFVRKTNEGHIS